MTSLLIAACRVELHPDGRTVTHLPDGSTVLAYPHVAETHGPEEVAAYAERARELGYGNDVFACSADHEIAHSLVAAALGLDASPTLVAVARGEVFEHAALEETAVLAVQRLARAMGRRLG